MISHEKKFIFIHIFKTGGSTIRKVLEPYADKRLSDFPLWDTFRHYVGMTFHSLTHWSMEHFTAEEFKRKLKPETYNSFFKFAFVRNPWDWQVSLYHYMLQNTNHRQHQMIKGMGSFEAYIRWRVTHEFKLQKDFLYDKHNQKLLDFTGRVENLQRDYDVVCERLDIPKIQLPVINASKHEHYRHYYNDVTRDLVYRRFREDVELFEYSF